MNYWCAINLRVPLHVVMKVPEWFPLFRFKKEAKQFSPYVTALPDLPLGETRKALVSALVDMPGREKYHN